MDYEDDESDYSEDEDSYDDEDEDPYEEPGSFGAKSSPYSFPAKTGAMKKKGDEDDVEMIPISVYPIQRVDGKDTQLEILKMDVDLNWTFDDLVNELEVSYGLPGEDIRTISFLNEELQSDDFECTLEELEVKRNSCLKVFLEPGGSGARDGKSKYKAEDLNTKADTQSATVADMAVDGIENQENPSDDDEDDDDDNEDNDDGSKPAAPNTGFGASSKNKLKKKEDRKKVADQTVKFDFRTGSAPFGVQVVSRTDGEVEAQYEQQPDGSQALLLDDGQYIELNLVTEAQAEENRLFAAEEADDANDKDGGAMSEKKKQKQKKKNKKEEKKKKDKKDAARRAIKRRSPAYTLTMDVKLDKLPPDGMALFTPDPDVSDEPACQINRLGGIGRFGQYGTRRAALKPGKWTRVVVVVTLGRDLGITTYVCTPRGAMRCASVRQMAFNLKEGPFALSNQKMRLFFPGSDSALRIRGSMGVRVKYLSVSRRSMSHAQVKEHASSDRIFSFWAAQEEEEEKQRSKAMSLQSLYKKPGPLFFYPPFLAEFGEAFVEGTGLEGGTVETCVPIYSLVFDKMLEMPEMTSVFDGFGLSHDQMQSLNRVSSILQDASKLCAKFRLALKGGANMVRFLKKLKEQMAALKDGDTLLVPGYISGAFYTLPMMYILERRESCFDFTVVNTDAEGGLAFHEGNAESPPVLKYKMSLVFKDVPVERMLDDAWWMFVLNMGIRHPHNTPKRLYNILLPWLTSKPLEETLVDTTTAESVDFRMPQLSKTAFHKCVTETVHLLLRNYGFTSDLTRKIAFAVRTTMVLLVKSDIDHLPGLDDCSFRILRLAWQQYAHNAATLAEDGLLEAWQLQEAKALIDRASIVPNEQGLKVQVFDMDYTNNRTDGPPPPLELVDNPKLSLFGLHELFGNNLITKSGEAVKLDVLKEKEVIGVFFAASWCPPCKQFTTALTQFYYQCRSKGVSFEVVFVSACNNRQKFASYFSDMPWLAIPYRNFQVRQRLNEHFGTKGIPSLILVDNTGAIICPDAVKKLAADPKGNKFPWQPRTVKSSKKPKPTLPAPYLHPWFDNLLRTEDVDGLAGTAIEASSYIPTDLLQVPERVTNFVEAMAAVRYCDKLCTLLSCQAEFIKNTAFLRAALIEHVYVQVLPVPMIAGSEDHDKCPWKMPLIYSQQLDMMLLLKRTMEHFASAALSIRATRSFDAVRIIVPGCIAAIADAIMRKRATDIPSEVCLHLMGETVLGEKVGAYGLSMGQFASQSETIEVHYPELNVARTGVHDYFSSQTNLQKIYKWEESMRCCDTTTTFIKEICNEVAFPKTTVPRYVDGLMHLMHYNYPEGLAYRDISFYFKYFLNTDKNAFPVFNPGTGYLQKTAQLLWSWDATNLCYSVTGFNKKLQCRPVPPADFTHRFPSGADPARIVSQFMNQGDRGLVRVDISNEDDILHVRTLPDFDQAIGQGDAELLLSYMTEPYLRIPLILTFFATEDRIHSLHSKALRTLLDSVLFEPGKYLPGSLTEVPHDVPTSKPELLATSYGLLVNELQHSPDTVIKCTVQLAKLALDLDAGTVHSSTLDIILYIVRLASRIDNYITFLIDYAKGDHQSMWWKMRGVNVLPETLSVLEAGQKQIHGLLRGELAQLIEGYAMEAYREYRGTEDEDVLDENTKIICNLNSHLVLIYRNVPLKDLTPDTVGNFMTSLVHLNSRHTWNKGPELLQVPEPEIYEALQVQRRRLVKWCHQDELKCNDLSEVMKSIVRVTTDTGTRAEPDTPDTLNENWGHIQGPRSCGRFAITSITRVREKDDAVISSVDDNQSLGAQVDFQVMQLTLRNSHVKALSSNIANMEDVCAIFGSQSMQATTVEAAEHRVWMRLVGRGHDLQMWQTPDTRLNKMLPDDYDRDYPEEIEDSEQWIMNIFEPVRNTYFVPPTIQVEVRFLLPEDALSPDATVARLLAVHPRDEGVWKEVIISKTLKTVQVYEVMSHGRRFYKSLQYCSNSLYGLRDLQPSTDPRRSVWPAWERHGAGGPYVEYPIKLSVVITRAWSTNENKSGGTEQYIPDRLLFGVLPSALLDPMLESEDNRAVVEYSRFEFWQDEDDNLRGYPIEQGDDDMIEVHIKGVERIDCTKASGYCGTVIRRTKADVQAEYDEALKMMEFMRSDLLRSASETVENGGDNEWENEFELFKFCKHLLANHGQTIWHVLNDVAAKHKDQQFVTTTRLENVINETYKTLADNASLSAAIAEMNTSSLVTVASSSSERLYLLSMLHSQPGSKLYSVAKVVSRLDRLAHALCWTKTKPELNGDYDVDLLEFPRLSLTFASKTDTDGVTRLYSADHAGLFIASDFSDEIAEMIRGIPHSLVLSNPQGDFTLLVPNVCPSRPRIMIQPFSTELVLNRVDVLWADVVQTPYHLYPVHVSRSFVYCSTLSSSLYLMVLRFLNRDYKAVFDLANSTATDNEYSEEEAHIFKQLALAGADLHPDAIACRLRISLVTIDAPVLTPWDLTTQMAHYVSKRNQVSASCHISHEDELQLLEMCADSVESKYYDPVKQHTVYKVTLIGNFKRMLQAMRDGQPRMEVDVPPRDMDTGWPWKTNDLCFKLDKQPPARMCTLRNPQWEVWSQWIQERVSNNKLAVMYFYDPSSTKCLEITEKMYELAVDPHYREVEILRIDATNDKMRSIVKTYNIMAPPAIVVFTQEEEEINVARGQRVMAQKRERHSRNKKHTHFNATKAYPARIAFVNEDATETTASTVVIKYDDEKDPDADAPRSLIRFDMAEYSEVGSVGERDKPAEWDDIISTIKEHMPSPELSAWRYNLAVGSVVDAQMSSGHWFPAIIVAISHEEVTVHFEKWSNACDEELEWDSAFIRDRGVLKGSYAYDQCIAALALEGDWGFQMSGRSEADYKALFPKWSWYSDSDATDDMHFTQPKLTSPEGSILDMVSDTTKSKEQEGNKPVFEQPSDAVLTKIEGQYLAYTRLGSEFGNLQYQVAENTDVLEIDFRSMKQTNLQTNVTIRIQRLEADPERSDADDQEKMNKLKEFAKEVDLGITRPLMRRKAWFYLQKAEYDVAQAVKNYNENDNEPMDDYEAPTRRELSALEVYDKLVGEGKLSSDLERSTVCITGLVHSTLKGPLGIDPQTLKELKTVVSSSKPSGAATWTMEKLEHWSARHFFKPPPVTEAQAQKHIEDEDTESEILLNSIVDYLEDDKRFGPLDGFEQCVATGGGDSGDKYMVFLEYKDLTVANNARLFLDGEKMDRKSVRLRARLMSDTRLMSGHAWKKIRRHWQNMEVFYEGPKKLSGHLALEAINRFWDGKESYDGYTVNYGFLLLYNLMSGAIPVKICGGGSGSKKDASTMVTLLVQLINDVTDRTMMASIMTTLSRNPHMCKGLPLFTDNRQKKDKKITALNDIDMESPLDNLFDELIRHMHREEPNLIAPPPPPHAVLKPPLTSCNVPKEKPRDWLVQRLTNFACKERSLKLISKQDLLAKTKTSTSGEVADDNNTSLISKDLDKLGMDDEERAAFSHKPIEYGVNLETFVQRLTRSELGAEPVSKNLPFDVSHHEQSRSNAAKDLISRLTIDVDYYATKVNSEKESRIVHLSDQDCKNLVDLDSPTRESRLGEAKSTVEELIAKLKALRTLDEDYVSTATPAVLRLAGDVAMDEETVKNDDKAERLQYLLRRECGQESEIWFEYIVGALLSENCITELQAVNPYLTEEAIETILDITVAAVLHANRVAHINRCLVDATSLMSLLGQVKVVTSDDGKRLETILAGLKQSSESLATGLLSERHFIRPAASPTTADSSDATPPPSPTPSTSSVTSMASVDSLSYREMQAECKNRNLPAGGKSLALRQRLIDDGFNVDELDASIAANKHNQSINAEPLVYDPRFLVFEFMGADYKCILLRKSQVTMVEDIVAHSHKGESVVKQMIMGAGKTTVVSPLLALILGDRKSLVMSIVPKALLEMTRNVMRSTFSSIVEKRIYTLNFDRSSDCNSAIMNKLENAIRLGGVVIATPTTIKSLQLRFIETLTQIADESRPRLPRMEETARQLSKVLRLFKDGVLMMDEVDVILHPLKSELNFPVGEKHDLDFSPRRWELPIHLIDCVFYADRNKMAVDFQDSQRAFSILEEMRVVIESGYEERALQSSPHIVLLNSDWYHEKMKPVLVKWAVLWLEKQRVLGLSENQMAEYVLHGANWKAVASMEKLYLEMAAEEPELAEERKLLAEVTGERTRKLKHLHDVVGSANVSAEHRKMLNLAHDWLNSFFPHVLQKIDRVSFGMLSKEEYQNAIKEDPHMPQTRAFLAVPFEGKDVPSKSSEFAHPDVTIGLTILAYRYEGMRYSDFDEVMSLLCATLEKEVGPYAQRKSTKRYENWITQACGKVRRRAVGNDDPLKIGFNLWSRDQKTAITAHAAATPGLKFDAAAMALFEKLTNDEKQEWREKAEMVPLRLLRRSNDDQMKKLFALLQFEPQVVHWYLIEIIFPMHMRHQVTKISASGQDLGGDMLFPKRIGFSGTPSDLLPMELGRCGYEKGSDGQMITWMADPSICSIDLIEDDWTVKTLLDRIATSVSPQYNALIDTGALITGMSNVQVAKYLLKHGLTWCEGIVFLDEYDRKMILVRATNRVQELAQCGISVDKRFAFYDQIHTTGMDIKHTLSAKAVLTLGKDMVFRDYVQGAFRMRGIGKGQTIKLFVIPEVNELIRRELKAAHMECTEDNKLEQVTAWLVICSMRSERVQFNQLCMQNVSNVWRKTAFRHVTTNSELFKVPSKYILNLPMRDLKAELKGKPRAACLKLLYQRLYPLVRIQIPKMAWEVTQMLLEYDQRMLLALIDGQNVELLKMQCMEVKKILQDLLSPDEISQIEQSQLEYDSKQDFEDSSNETPPPPQDVLKSLTLFEEPVDYSLDASVPDPLPFADTLQAGMDSHDKWIVDETERSACNAIVAQVRGNVLDNLRAALETEQTQEQEEEREKEMEDVKEKEIEIEKYVDLAYARDNEEPIPWEFSTLAGPTAESALQFYPATKFSLYKRKGLQFPNYTCVSKNYFNPKWGGDRRIKNVVMLLEWIPSMLAQEEYPANEEALSPRQEEALERAFKLFDISSNGHIEVDELANVIRASMDIEVDKSELMEAIANFQSPDAEDDDLDNDISRVMSGRRQIMDLVRTLSGPQRNVLGDLNESGLKLNLDGMRRLLRSGKYREELSGRYTVAVSLAEAATIRRIMHLRLGRDIVEGGTDTAIALRALPANNMLLDVSAGFREAGRYMTEASRSAMRFLNSEMYFTEPQLNILLRALQKSPERERRRFFISIIGCRRRMQRKHEQTPLMKIFTVEDEWAMLKQRAQATFFREKLISKGLKYADAFTFMDADKNGYLSAAEIMGTFFWLGANTMTKREILEFIRTHDSDGDGSLSYAEFVSMLRLDKTDEDDDEDLDVDFDDDDDVEDEEEGAGGGLSSSLAFDDVPMRMISTGGTSYDRIKPMFAEELSKLQNQINKDIQNEEEEEEERIKEEEQRLKEEKIHDEEKRNLEQPGGPNPNVNTEAGLITFFFTRANPPLRMLDRSGGKSPVAYDLQDFEEGKVTRVLSESMLFLPLCLSTSEQFASTKRFETWTVSVHMMLDKLPGTGRVTSLLNTDPNNETDALVYIDSTGTVTIAGATADHLTTDRARLTPGYWYVLTVSVDTKNGVARTWIDDKLSLMLNTPAIAPNTKYSLDANRLCLFGSKNLGETIGVKTISTMQVRLETLTEDVEVKPIVVLMSGDSVRGGLIQESRLHNTIGFEETNIRVTELVNTFEHVKKFDRWDVIKALTDPPGKGKQAPRKAYEFRIGDRVQQISPDYKGCIPRKGDIGIVEELGSEKFRNVKVHGETKNKTMSSWYRITNIVLAKDGKAIAVDEYKLGDMAFAKEFLGTRAGLKVKKKESAESSLDDEPWRRELVIGAQLLAIGKEGNFEPGSVSEIEDDTITIKFETTDKSYSLPFKRVSTDLQQIPSEVEEEAEKGGDNGGDKDADGMKSTLDEKPVEKIEDLVKKVNKEMYASLASKDADKLKTALQNGGDPNWINEDSTNKICCLLQAVFVDFRDGVQLLIDHGVDVNRVNPGGWSALVQAGYSGRYECCVMLLDAGADTKFRGLDSDKTFKTALEFAVKHKKPKVVELLEDTIAERSKKKIALARQKRRVRDIRVRLEKERKSKK